MPFKMQCPKCKGLDYSIERDNRTFGAVAQAFELVFHCRCGKQMFGEQILKEYEAQKKEWEADTTRDPDAEEVPERSSQRAAREQLEQVFEAKRAAEAPRAEPSFDDDDDDDDDDEAEAEAPQPAKPAKKAAAKPKKAAAKPASAAPAVGVEICAWPGCENPSRKNSKYCSRACSNKNARHRHKLRAKTGDE